MNRFLQLIGFVFFMLMISDTAIAQNYPLRPIKIIVGFPPGGGSDAMARIMASALSTELKVAVTVENKVGAGGVIGTDFLAKSAPDGYTLQLATPGSYTIAPSLRKLPYDPVKDIQPVCMLATYPNLIVASTASGITSLADLVAKAKADPSRFNFASSGNGTTPHLAFEYFNMVAGVKITHIPYKGNGPAIADLLAGQVHLTVADPLPLLPHIQSGKIKALALTTKARSGFLPNLPSMTELGFPQYDVPLWLGITAPAGLPEPVLVRLNDAISKIMANPEIIEKFAAGGMDAGYTPASTYSKIMAEERIRWADVIKRNNITD